MLISYKNILD